MACIILICLELLKIIEKRRVINHSKVLLSLFELEVPNDIMFFFSSY